MKRTLSAIALALLAVLSGPIRADHQEEMDAAEAHAEVSPEVAGLIASFQEAAEKLVALAEATPADKFSWAPNEEVRTVSAVYIHVVGANLFIPAGIGATPLEGLEMTGNPFAMMSDWEANVTDKDTVIGKLKESIAYAGEAMASIKDLDTEVTLFGPPAPKRNYLHILASHAHEHLGQSIAYARSVGVVPPWSQPLPSGDEAEMEDAEGAER